MQLALVTGLQIVMAVELTLLLSGGQWLHAFLVAGVIAATLAPTALRIDVPAEIQIAVVVFVFATLFLGEVRNYYERFWWWDLALHGTAGLLLGLFGFMIVYMLNRSEAVDLHMRPAFLALFAFFFAVGIGALWEVFEFAMDQVFGLNMQKPMLGDPSGLTDTMWDIIVDTLGAGAVALVGWYQLSRSKSRSDNWLRRFIARHPRFFGQS
ncbi:MAG TPA: hypothetical protein VGR19_00895 [Allosphingosinicella sp.]|nr:hypothetical protein [Allosphingosinicella sp.]